MSAHAGSGASPRPAIRRRISSSSAADDSGVKTVNRSSIAAGSLGGN